VKGASDEKRHLFIRGLSIHRKRGAARHRSLPDEKISTGAHAVFAGLESRLDLYFFGISPAPVTLRDGVLPEPNNDEPGKF
jgi:hypothetical protein